MKLTRPTEAKLFTQGDYAFLLESSRLLGQTLDAERTLATVARLSWPNLGSWCVVDLIEAEHMRRLAIIHPDPGQQSLADQLLSGWPPHRDDPLGLPSAVRTSRAEVVAPVTDAMLIAAARSPENLEILRALQIGSFMTVPLIARGKVIGAITYVSPKDRDSFSPDDLVLAEDLAARCAIAIDNTRLMRAADAATKLAESAQLEAEEANLVKVRFLATMSHELRTPLNAIAGYAELLETGVVGAISEEQRDYVHRIQANQRHLLGLVESVLNYAKVDSGRIEFGLKDIALSNVIAHVQQIIEPIAAEKGVKCIGLAPAEGDTLTVYAAADKLCQILVNIVGNAIKFSDPGTTVELTRRVTGAHVEIRVADNGIGIAPEDHEQIFDPFIQLQNDMTNRPGGTGLGLAISRELAAGMRGTLTVESAVGRGSTFSLRLPRGRY
jgi:signal transduction histidine kinase